MKNGNVNRISSWEKINSKDIKYIGRKNADYGIFNSFIMNIPLSYQDKFLKNISMEQRVREKIKVKILCNNEVFESILFLPKLVSGNRSIALVYNEDLQKVFKKKLEKSYSYTTAYYSRFNKKLFNIPRKYSEYIDFYIGSNKNTFIIKLISRETIDLEEKTKECSDKKRKFENLEYFKSERIIENRKLNDLGIEESELKSERIDKERVKFNGKESEEEVRWKLGVQGDKDFQNIKYNYLRDNEVAIGEEDDKRNDKKEKFDFNELVNNVYKVANSLKEVYAKELCEYILSLKNLNEEKAYKELEKELINIRSRKYERDLDAREKCLDKYGVSCMCCGINLEETYGKYNHGNIEVHYIKDYKELEEGYILNPHEDLRPICPNCHSIIHSRIPTYKIDELIDKIQRRK